MSDLFYDGEIFNLLGGRKCQVIKFLGNGTQGAVYHVKIAGQDFALKWYFRDFVTTQQQTNLDNLIRIGAPSKRFLWPLEVVLVDGKPNFGYLMHLREPKFKGIINLLARRMNPEPTFTSLSIACVNLADSFLQLHSLGLCYRAVSFGNIYFSPIDGEIMITDIDFVLETGKNSSKIILGTPGFMAPEIVRGEALPDSHTDRYSLAVLLFYMLFISHPLDGINEAKIHSFDYPAMLSLYGKNPIFIFDPKDTSNRPVKGIHDNALIFWEIYPQFLKDRFIEVFTEGLWDPNARVMETIWRMTMARLHDSIILCPTCRAENFYCERKISENRGKPGVCWQCKKPLRLPPYIRFGNDIVMLNSDTKLYKHHIDPGASCAYEQPVSEVTQHPRNPSVWGLRNLTNNKWSVKYPDGHIIDLEPGRNVSLQVGIEINFGVAVGIVESF